METVTMFENRAPGDRFFARIRSLDLECPRCGEVYHCTGKTATVYKPRTARFKCPSCGLGLAIGVIAYPVTTAAYPKPPEDWVPTWKQGLALRNQISGFVAENAKGWTDPRNVVVREGCKCLVKKRGLIIHPLCPIHGVADSQTPGRSDAE